MEGVRQLDGIRELISDDQGGGLGLRGGGLAPPVVAQSSFDFYPSLIDFAVNKFITTTLVVITICNNNKLQYI